MWQINKLMLNFIVICNFTEEKEIKILTEKQLVEENHVALMQTK